MIKNSTIATELVEKACLSLIRWMKWDDDVDAAYEIKRGVAMLSPPSLRLILFHHYSGG